MKIDTIYAKSSQSMSEVPSNFIDLIATDPPFGISFMGKAWDKAIPPIEIWREALRVLKPGAFAFVMCIPRQDCLARMIMSLDDAGFWVGFTSMFHAFASGFPKAGNVAKMVDKRLGAKRKVCGKYQLPDGQKWNLKQAEDNNIPHVGGKFTASKTRTLDITTPATPEARALDGSYAGFQPKPAVEVILVAMKPLSEKSYVDQALRNGKGISWLDKGRIPYENDNDKKIAIDNAEGGYKRQKNWKLDDKRQPMHGGWKKLKEENFIIPQGRFPANLLISDDALNDGKMSKCRPDKRNTGNLDPSRVNWRFKRVPSDVSDSGSFSRYFSLDSWWENRLSELPKSVQKTFPFLIVPKASKAEKNRGCEGLDDKLMARSGGAQQAEKQGKEEYLQKHIGLNRITKVKNNHPTCKPIKLMSYLITLGSREDDIVLDPFVGSGTTAIAAKMLKRRYIGYEIDPEYCRIAEARLSVVQRELF